MSAHQPSVTMSRCRYQSWLYINHPWQCRDVNISLDCTSTIHDDVEMSISVKIAHQPSVTMSRCGFQSWLYINQPWPCRDVDISNDCTSIIHGNVEMSISVMIVHQSSVTMSRCQYQSWLYINHPWRCRDVDISHECTSSIRDDIEISSSEVFYFSVLIYAKLYTTWTFQYHTSIDPRPIYFPLADTDVIFLKLCYILYIYCLCCKPNWLHFVWLLFMGRHVTYISQSTPTVNILIGYRFEIWTWYLSIAIHHICQVLIIPFLM